MPPGPPCASNHYTLIHYHPHGFVLSLYPCSGDVYRAQTEFLTESGGLKFHASARLALISSAMADVDIMKLLMVRPLPAFGSKILRSPELV